MLPESFIYNLRSSLGRERADSVLKALDTPSSVSIRFNTEKINTFLKAHTEGISRLTQVGENIGLNQVEDDLSFYKQVFSLPISKKIEWASDAYALSERPLFTYDPLFQAGAYYVQEASSMAIEALNKYLPEKGSLKALDLCAAPGGKSTHLLSILRQRGDNSFLVSNEVIRSRAGILAENITRWGAVNVAVTNNDPADFKAFTGYFDLMVVDAPCSGEGMFRKDMKAREEWSPENVELCASRQKRILSNIWHVLKPGGIIVYSTCTFNRYENEDNVEWISSELGAECLESRHFYPGENEVGEGFFMSILRKEDNVNFINHVDNSVDFIKIEKNNKNSSKFVKNLPKEKSVESLLPKIPYLIGDFAYFLRGEFLKAYPKALLDSLLFVERNLRCVHSGVLCASVKGEGKKAVLIPEADLALCSALNEDAFNSVELYEEPDNLYQLSDSGDSVDAVAEDAVASGSLVNNSRGRALKFLRKEALEFDGEPLGYLLLKYKGLPLGFVKNIGRRSNNLWPSGWRILK